MRVEGSSQGNSAEVIARIQEQFKSRGASKDDSVQNGAPGAAPESPEAAPAGEEDGAKGVIRLLQEGHFRGVADVRLRINFAEELQGIAAGNVSGALKEGLTALQGELNAAIDAFVEGGTLSEEEVNTLRTAQESFNTQVNSLLEGDALTEEVFGALRTAFEDFLKGLVPPEESEETPGVLPVGETDEEVPAEALAETEATTPLESPEEPVADPFSGLRETLTGLFNQSLSSLQESLDALALPPLSEPQGNGRAYEKFLATYNELYGVGDVEQPPVSDNGLNTTV